VYRRILAVDAENADAMHFYGIAQHQRGDSATGIALIHRSIQLGAQSDRYNNLGNVLLEVEDYAAATIAYQNALALNSTHADACNNLGVLLKAQKRFEEAEAAYAKAIDMNPAHVDAYNNMGNVLVAQGRMREGVTYFCKAITLMPNHKEARKLLGIAYYTLGENDKAAAVYREWLEKEPDNPVPRHHLAACTRESVPMRAEDAYVEMTFDAFADSFDAKLGHLDYRAPQLLADTFANACGTPRKQFDALDAGCGTGLCGPLIAPYCKRLIGVDLSSGMLEKAQARKVYDQLIKAELTAFLQSQPAAYDIIISADTLVYFGALDDVFIAAHTALRQNGRLLFTVEASVETADTSSSNSGYVINPHGRYSHSESYVRNSLVAANFTDIEIAHATLRREAGAPVRGFVVSCVAHNVSSHTST
jgi:predicted TPR repeat methyltransferase